MNRPRRRQPANGRKGTNMNKVYIKRLENLIRALDESPNPGAFTMDYFAHNFDTPACVLGHYVLRRDLQRVFKLRGGFPQDSRTGEWISYHFDVVLDHFGINKVEASDLFASGGCGDAKTPEEACAYIKTFIDQRISKSELPRDMEVLTPRTALEHLTAVAP